MTNPMIEAAARAITIADGANPDGAMWPSDDPLWQGAIPAAQAAITAIEPMIRADERAKTEREIVEWLREQDGHGYDDMRANLIEAGEYRK